MRGRGAKGGKEGLWLKQMSAVQQVSGTLCNGTVSASLCQGCYSQRLLPQEYGDCIGLETEVSIFLTEVAEP